MIGPKWRSRTRTPRTPQIGLAPQVNAKWLRGEVPEPPPNRIYTVRGGRRAQGSNRGGSLGVRVTYMNMSWAHLRYIYDTVHECINVYFYCLTMGGTIINLTKLL